MTVAESEQLRENLIQTAVKFLTNPNVQRCTIESKEKFLRAKGLSDAEIQKAFQKGSEMLNLPLQSPEFMFLSNFSRTSWFKEKVLPIIVYSGFAYGLYWFYKNVLRDLIFVERPHVKTTAECLEEVKNALQSLNSNITSLKTELEIITSQQNANSHMRKQLDIVKADINSVKGILLNRNQFPSLKTRPEPPSIPAWQRQSEEITSDPDHHEGENLPMSKTHRGRTQRSGSGGSNSSEGDANTKNSDSSLEIIT